jgi:hypothetical protein
VAGTVDVIDSAGHRQGSATTDSAGRYAIPLPEGAYILRVVTEGLFPACPETQVSVTAGPPAIADIDCDTGIR